MTGYSTAVLRRLGADRRVRYLLTGALAAGVYYALFSLGWLALGAQVPYPVLAVCTSSACAIVTYPVYRGFVFGAVGPWLRSFCRFYVLGLWAMVFNVAGLWALVDGVRLPVLVAQAVVLIAGPLVNYQVSRLWAFRPVERRGAR